MKENRVALIIVAAFRGGAPISMREYGNCLKEQGWKVIVAGKIIDEEQIVFDASYELINYEPYKEGSVSSLFYSSLMIHTIISKRNISLVLCASRNEFTPCSNACKAAGVTMIPIIPGGEINPKAKNLIEVRKIPIICFSQENKEALISAGVKEELISVISNRIHCKPDLHWLEYYKNRQSDVKLIILLTSRLDETLIPDVIHFMNRIYLLNKSGMKINLKICGSGKCESQCYERAKEINSDINCVEMLGFKKKLYDEILQSDIVVGKGRSVIEPIMDNRIGFVLGHDGKISLCTIDNYINLYNYNFSGRFIEKNTSDEGFKHIIRMLKNDLNYVVSFNTVFCAVRELYSSDCLKNKLNSVINRSRITQNEVDRNLSNLKLYYFIVRSFIHMLARMIQNKGLI